MAKPGTPATPLEYRAIWAIALPAMATNVATAMIGVGDMWIVGRLGDAPTQGAVDIGARLFAMLFVVMNFLKTGTTGLVAQAGTRRGAQEQAAVLMRGLAVGLAIACALLAAKPLLLPALLTVLGAEGEVLGAARVYAEIRYWSAPAVMANFALVGFLVGRRQMRAVLAFEVGYNLLNLALGAWLALGLDWGIAGIGWSSFIAEVAKLAAVAGFIMFGAKGKALRAAVLQRGTLRWAELRPFLSVNRDLFLRTLVLMVALAALTRLSAERGVVSLAANGIFYQLFVVTALLLDGFENAAQVLNGERLGARDREGFVRYIGALLWRGLGVALVLSALFAAFAGPVIDSFAATPEIAVMGRQHAIWLAVIPVAGFAAFVYDGVFVGASWTRALLGSMIGASALYAVLLWLTWPLGNDGLWLSFAVFLAARALFQAVQVRRLTARSFPA